MGALLATPQHARIATIATCFPLAISDAIEKVLRSSLTPLHALAGGDRVLANAPQVYRERSRSPRALHAHLLAFNGRTKQGRTAVWVQAYAGNPPVSFVLPFHVRHQPGPFRTVLVSVVPRSVGPWPHFAHFQIVVGRRFSYCGHVHSYMSASCPVPPRFTEGFLSFARATFNLAEGSPLRAEAVRSCRARG